MTTARKGQTAFETTEIFDDDTGRLRLRLIYKKSTGLLHAPPDGRPSHLVCDFWGRPTFQAWHKDDVQHRENGPSEITLNPKNGVQWLEMYHIEGQPRPKSDGYYIIRRDKESGEITSSETDEDWYRRHPEWKPKLDGPEPG